MKIYFSPTQRGFYNDEIFVGRTMMVADPTFVTENGGDPPLIEVANPGCNIPIDAVEITADHYAAMIAGQSVGQEIIAGPNGAPELRDPPPLSIDDLFANLRATRTHMLASTDGIVARHRDQKEAGGATTLSDASYAQLQAVRQALRDLPANTTDPLHPVYPDLTPWLAA